jgi:tetratricopeptide (TPR) repeat protein
MTSGSTRDTAPASGSIRDASDSPADDGGKGQEERPALESGPPQGAADPARRPPPYLKAALEAAEAARARAAEVRARYDELAVAMLASQPRPAGEVDESSGHPASLAVAPPVRPEGQPGPRFAPRAANGHEDGAEAQTSAAGRFFSVLHRPPRQRLALLCLAGLLSGGVAGAALGGFHFLIFGQQPAVPGAAAPQAQPADPAGSAAAVAEAEAQRGGRASGRRGIEVLSELPRADVRTPEAGNPGPARPEASSGAAAGEKAQREQVRVAAVAPRLTPGPALEPVQPDAAAPPEPAADAPRAEPAAPTAPDPVPAKPMTEPDLAGKPLPLPPPAAPRDGGAVPGEVAAAKAGPDAWSELYEHARRLEEEGDLEEAIAAYKEAVAADPRHAVTFYDLGYAQQKAGRPEAAIAAYRAALDRNPKHAYAHYNLGYLLQQRGSLGAAIANYREAAVLDQDNPYVFYNWGEILDRQGDVQGAIDLYKRASELAPDGPPGLDAKARLDRLEEDAG